MPVLPLSLDYISKVLTEYFADKPVQRVQIFGSYARGEATAASDLDLLLHLESDSQVTLFDLSRYQADLEDTLHLTVDVGTKLDPYIRRYIEPDLILAYERTAA